MSQLFNETLSAKAPTKQHQESLESWKAKGHCLKCDNEEETEEEDSGSCQRKIRRPGSDSDTDFDIIQA